MKRKLSKPAVTHGAKVLGRDNSLMPEKFIRFCESDFGKTVMGLEAAYLHKELFGCTKILDVGCGIGSIEERLPGLNIIGLDSSEDVLAEARKRSDKKFVKGEAISLSFASGSFDAVFMLTTLEFITDYKKALDEATRVLATKGRLVIMLLNQESDYFKTHYAKEGDYFRNIRHTDYRPIVRYASLFFNLNTGYFLGIDGKRAFESRKAKWASLFVIKGTKK